MRSCSGGGLQGLERHVRGDAEGFCDFSKVESASDPVQTVNHVTAVDVNGVFSELRHGECIGCLEFRSDAQDFVGAIWQDEGSPSIGSDGTGLVYSIAQQFRNVQFKRP